MNLAGKIFHITRWGTSILLIGLLTGAMAVLFPPLAVIGVVALVATVLLWALPELRFVPEKLLRTMFFIMLAVQLCVPSYYAIETGYLPWISVRRLFAFAVIILFSLTVAGSKSARGKIAETVRANRLLAFFSFGFFAMIFISIFTSVNVPQSLSLFSDSLLNWFVPLLACILIVRSEEDVVLLMKIIAFAMIFDALAGLIEFVLQRPYLFDIFPKGMLDSMLAKNKALAAIYFGSPFRQGLYRASSIYLVSLSFAEFAAMAAPISAYFVFHGRDRREQSLGIAAGVCSLIGVFCSGSRGGYTALLVAMPIMLCLWVFRYSKLNPQSLVGGIAGGIFVVGTACVFVLVAFWPRLNVMVTGGSEGSMSTQARFEQWELALPHIISNPVTGHGIGNSGVLVGYHMESGLPSVDSYIITLLVDMGIPGLLLFFGMIAVVIWTSLRVYITDADKRAAVSGPIACCLIAFMVYRLALSQTENHVLVFLIVGLVFTNSKLTQDRLARNGRANFRTSHSNGVLEREYPVRGN